VLNGYGEAWGTLSPKDATEALVVSGDLELQIRCWLTLAGVLRPASLLQVNDQLHEDLNPPVVPPDFRPSQHHGGVAPPVDQRTSRFRRCLWRGEPLRYGLPVLANQIYLGQKWRWPLYQSTDVLVRQCRREHRRRLRHSRPPPTRHMASPNPQAPEMGPLSGVCPRSLVSSLPPHFLPLPPN